MYDLNFIISKMPRNIFEEMKYLEIMIVADHNTVGSSTTHYCTSILYKFSSLKMYFNHCLCISERMKWIYPLEGTEYKCFRIFHILQN